MTNAEMKIRDARKALSDTGLIELDVKVGQMMASERSAEARLVAAAYNTLAEVHAILAAGHRKVA